MYAVMRTDYRPHADDHIEWCVRVEVIVDTTHMLDVAIDKAIKLGPGYWVRQYLESK